MDMTSRMTSHFRDAMATYEQSMSVLAEPLAIAVDAVSYTHLDVYKRQTPGHGDPAKQQVNARRRAAP